MFSSFLNWVVFKTDRLNNDDSKFKGVGGQSILVDTTWDPKRHVNCQGEVVSVPKHLSNVFISQRHKGIPTYNDYSPYQYKYLSDIVPEIEPGDKIYFHFNTIIPNNLVKTETENGKKVYYFKVRYDQVICAVRGGFIIPNASYILIEPDMETWEDILMPILSDIVGPDGKRIPKPKDQWLQKKIVPEKRFLLGFVRHTGTPLKGETCDVVPGDRVIYRRNADWTNKIEGKDYFAILHRHIIGKYVDGKVVPVGNNIFIDPEKLPMETEAGVQKIKAGIPVRGTVIHPGKSSLNVGDFVEFGECDRQPIDIEGHKFLSMDHGNIWAIHLAKSA